MSGFLRNASQGRVANGAGLLENFLEHEMLEAALLCHDRVPGHVLYLSNNRFAFEIGKLYALGSDHSKIAITQKKQIAGVIENCRHVGSYKIFVFAQADYSRRSVAGGEILFGSSTEITARAKTPVNCTI